MLVKCKPVYNFQSVEFEIEVNSPKDEKAMFELYRRILEGLKEISIEQPPLAKAVPVKQEPKASPKQVSLLIKLGVDEQEAKNMSATVANKKISELING